MPPIQTLGDSFIWITSILAGFSVLYGLLKYVSALLENRHDKALLGDWFEYGFFQSHNGPHFYKERVTIKRDMFLPWRLTQICKPVTAGKSTSYRGRFISRPPFLYGIGFDPVYNDRTFEILHRKMDTRLHDADTFIGIHLGKTYEETMHCACAVVMTRRELDPNVSPVKSADINVEKAKFTEIISPYLKIERGSYQMILL